MSFETVSLTATFHRHLRLNTINVIVNNRLIDGLTGKHIKSFNVYDEPTVILVYQGRPSPLRQRCISPLFQISKFPKYDHISTYMRDILRWLPARQRIKSRMAALL